MNTLAVTDLRLLSEKTLMGSSLKNILLFCCCLYTLWKQ